MARKTKIIPIEAIEGVENRDAGKTFLITEKPAIQAKKWSDRFFAAMDTKAMVIPPGISALGMVGVYLLAINAMSGAPWGDVDRLMDELLDCVQFVPEPPLVPRPLVREVDFEEISTINRLCWEVIALHGNFTLADALSTLTSALQLQQARSADIQTSETTSEPSSLSN
jgi:hypothetical protein